MNMEIYTDGSCLSNPGKGGCATVFTKNNQLLFSVIESFPNTTNQRMELMAIINALKYISDKAIIYTDSAYCLNSITQYIHAWVKNGWQTSTKKPVANQDLWKLYLENSKNLKLEFVKVKAHSGNKFNETADFLAKYSAMNQN